MKKLLVPIVLVSVTLSGCAYVQANAIPEEAQTNQAIQQSDKAEAEKKDVISLVESFGKKLQMVSLLAPEELVRKSMKEHYAEFVTPALLEAWLKNPQNAPGRQSSSPWPDRIEVQQVEKLSDDAYQVKGVIIEITSAELQHGGAAAKRPITLTVRKTGDRWLIDAVEMGAYEDANAESIQYENTEYGFRFVLPSSWKGFTIVTDKWEGLSLEKSQEGKVVAEGPIISIRHPKWTEQQPRQDIPIMVFTVDQWNQLSQQKFHIGAAPVGPRELGRNAKYVFALPARYNFAFLPGYEEVEEILNNNSLQPIESSASS